jgi:hypothetical protein
MDEYALATQRLAHAARTLRLVNFKLMQLRHTYDQLRAGVQDLLDQARRLAQARQMPDDHASQRVDRKDPRS